MATPDLFRLTDVPMARLEPFFPGSAASLVPMTGAFRAA